MERSRPKSAIGSRGCRALRARSAPPPAPRLLTRRGGPSHEVPHPARCSRLPGLRRRRRPGRHRRRRSRRGGGTPAFEVWLIDQQGLGRERRGGRLHIFHGEPLVDDPIRLRRPRRSSSATPCGPTASRDRQRAAAPAHARLQRRRQRRSGRQHPRRDRVRRERARRVPRRHHARAGGLRRRGRPGPRRLADPRPEAPDRGQPGRQEAAADRHRLRDEPVHARGRRRRSTSPRAPRRAAPPARTRRFVPTTRRSARAPRATAPSPS